MKFFINVYRFLLKTKSQLPAAIYTALFIFTVFGCNQGSETRVPYSNPVDTGANLVEIQIAPNPISLQSGESLQLSATGIYDTGQSQEITTQVSWSSVGTGIIQISPSGLLQGMSLGNDTITASDPNSNISASAPVAVVTLTEITISPNTSSILVGEFAQFTANAKYSNNVTEDVTSRVTWSSDAPEIASVNSSGLATGITSGQVTITAEDPITSLSANSSLTVSKDPNAFYSEGYLDAVVLTLGVPYNGEVKSSLFNSPQLTSYYRIGVTPGTPYYIGMTSRTDYAELSIYNDSAFNDSLCYASDGFSLSDIYCLTSNSLPTTNNMYINVTAPFADTYWGRSGGANYTLIVRQAYQSEGTYSVPVPLTLNVPYSGHASSYLSYYSLQTDPGALYRVAVTSMSDDIYIETAWLYNATCTYNTGTVDDACEIISAGGSIISIPVASEVPWGSAYTITASQVRPAYNSEGSVSSPVTILLGTPDAGQVDIMTSYYQVSAVPGKAYQVKVIAPDDDIVLSVYDNDSNYYSSTCYSDKNNNGDEQCLLEPASGNMLYFSVSGGYTQYGAGYTIQVDEINYTPQGSIDSPILLGQQPMVADNLTVDTTASYFEAPVTSGNLYEVKLSGFNDLDLYLYDDMSFSSLLCSSATTGTVDKICTTTTRPTGSSIFIKIDGSNSLYGSKYSIEINRVYEKEGTLVIPQALTVGSNYLGQVGGGGTSFYQCPVTTGKRYQILISASDSGDAFLEAFDGDATFTNNFLPCNMWTTYFPYSCLISPMTSSTLYIRTNANYSTYGDGYTFSVNNIPFSSEGTPDSPINLGLFPVNYSGELDATANYYKVLIDDTNTDYIFKLTPKSADLDLEIHGSPDFTDSPLCAPATRDTNPETCILIPNLSTLYIKIIGAPSGFGGMFDLMVDRNYTDEGFIRNKPNDPGPVSLTLGASYEGEVSHISYYEIAVTPGITYNISMNQIAGGNQLYVFDGDATFTYIDWYIDNNPAGDKILDVTPTTDMLYIKSVRDSQYSGGAYSLIVQ